MLCRGYGLTIDTTFDLPGAVPGAGAPAAIDLVIAEGGADLPDPEATRGAYGRSGDRLALTVPGIGRFRLDGLGQLAVSPDAAVARRDVSELLIASALPMALWRRGGVVLHAGGVELDGGGIIAIAGSSGAGKSTLARLLIERGARLAGDDSLWLRQGDGAITAHGLAGGWFLPEDGGSERRFHPLATARQASQTCLAAIVVLAPAGPAALRRLDALAAVQALLRHRHRPNIPALLGRDAEVLAWCTRLAAMVPIYALGRVEGDPAAAAAAIASISRSQA